MYNSMYYNGFNPYIMPKPSFTKNIFGSINKINWSNVLNNTQKTLNVINQAIPVYYQIKPIYNNAKTMFRILGSLNDKKPSTIKPNLQDNTDKKNISNQPIFFN